MTDTYDEKPGVGEFDDDLKKEPVVAATQVVIGDEAFQQAMIKEPPKRIPPFIVMLGLGVAFCCSSTNGYDGSLFSTLLANQDFLDFWKITNVGEETGVITAMYQIGNVVAIPFIGPCIDTWGRRVGMLIGSAVIVLGVVIQVTCIVSESKGQFMAGRFLLGYGVGIAAAAGPIYVVEVAHPAYRGIVGGLYNIMWPVGALIASCAARGGLAYKGTNNSWMIPVGLQMMFPGLVCLCVMFLPESPRWLYTRGKRELAISHLTNLHGGGNRESEWVKLQLMEYEQYLEMEGSDKRWWDYRALFRDRASIYRLSCNCIVSCFGQWAGNGIVSYFLAGFLDTAGITGDIRKTNVAVGMNAIQIAFACVGASIVDKVGRRPMLITVNIVCGLCWIGVIVPASIANVTDTADESQTSNVAPPVSRTVLAFVYIFQICYSVGWTPMQALYPVEVLSYEMRAKGMAFSSLFTTIALMTNQFGVPVALKRIAWQTYIVFCVWCFVQAIVLYFLVPETKNRTLEELDEIFHSKNPVKTSIAKKKLDVDADHNVVHVDGAYTTGASV